MPGTLKARYCRVEEDLSERLSRGSRRREVQLGVVGERNFITAVLNEWLFRIAVRRNRRWTRQLERSLLEEADGTARRRHLR